MTPHKQHIILLSNRGLVSPPVIVHHCSTLVVWVNIARNVVKSHSNAQHFPRAARQILHIQQHTKRLSVPHHPHIQTHSQKAHFTTQTTDLTKSHTLVHRLNTHLCIVGHQLWNLYRLFFFFGAKLLNQGHLWHQLIPLLLAP